MNITISIDIITIIVSAVLIVAALTTPFLNAFFRKPQNHPTENDKGSEDLTPEPPLSIIIAPHENAFELEQQIPYLLNQDYPAGFQIIVVTWKGDSETNDVMKRFASDSRIYTTYVPDSSRYMSRTKLAITLGVKAAKNEWMLLTDATCIPASNQWLRLMARHCTTEKSLVIGHTVYSEETAPYRRFERLHNSMYLLREAHKHIPYRHEGCNLLFRKSMFIQGDGYRGNLKYIRGEYDFLVNKYATATNSALETTPRAWMIEQSPTDKTWKNKHLFYLENRKSMSRSFSHRFLYNLDQCAQHINYLMILSAFTYSILTQKWIITAAATLSLFITIILRTAIGKKTINSFNEDISLWAIIPYEISILWHNIGYMLRHARANSDNFISHKI